MRAFETFGLVPFLFADENGQAQLKSLFLKKSRLCHPDHAHSEAQRNEFEVTNAILNSDYVILKNNELLVEYVLNESNKNGAPLTTAKSNTPPALAADYFELQEWLEEESATNQERQSRIDSFVTKAREQFEKAQKLLHEKTRRFSFVGPGNSLKYPWISEDLAPIRVAYQNFKYMKSFLNDVETKLKSGGGHAHTN